jgi:hypothetical protein
MGTYGRGEMRNPWVGLDLAADPAAWARLLRRAHDLVASGAPAPSIVRDVVTQSWERSRSAGLDPERHEAPLALEEREARARWRAHPLARFSDLIRSMLGSYTHDARHIVVISDADGCLLWSDGHSDVLKASGGIDFVPGHVWTESAAGTNGVGTALALGHPVQIFSAEHFNRQVHGWTCSGAPVRDPETGEILGVLDLSSGVRAAHPNSLALVTAVADVITAQLRIELAERDARIKGRYLERLGAGGGGRSALVSPAGRTIAAVPSGWLPGPIALPAAGAGTATLPDGSEVEVEPLPRGEGFVVRERERSRRPATLRLRVLGRARAVVSHGDGVVTLSPRHSEIVTLLLLRPEGLTAEELAQELYGDPSKRVSVRAELSRLRRALGSRFEHEPYRIAGEASSDLDDVRRLLAVGRPESALKLARGPLLPGARAPAIVAAREQLERALGRAG